MLSSQHLPCLCPLQFVAAATAPHRQPNLQERLQHGGAYILLAAKACLGGGLAVTAYRTIAAAGGSGPCARAIIACAALAPHSSTLFACDALLLLLLLPLTPLPSLPRCLPCIIQVNKYGERLYRGLVDTETAHLHKVG